MGRKVQQRPQPKPKEPDVAEQMQNDMARIKGQRAWYAIPESQVSKERKRAVAKKMGAR